MHHAGCLEWRIERHRRVSRWLRRHPEAKPLYQRAVELLRRDPYAGEPLHGSCQGLRRLRLGTLRIVYHPMPGECIVSIEAVGYRENVYEELGC